MSEAFKLRLRGRCGELGFHIGPFDESLDDDGTCDSCSSDHVDEFGDCVGLVEDRVFPDNPTAPEVNVRWLPSRLRYGYFPEDLDIV